MIWNEKIINLLKEDTVPLVLLNENPFYNGNKNLRKANVVYELSDAEKLEIEQIADINYFIDNYWFLNGYCIKLFDWQKEFLKELKDNRFNILSHSRQIGFFTILSIYITHIILTRSNATIIIVDAKNAQCVELISKIKTIYESLPLFMKPGILAWNAKSLSFDNGCKIIANSNVREITNKNGNYWFLLSASQLPNFDSLYKSTLLNCNKKDDRMLVASIPTNTTFCDLFMQAEEGKTKFKPHEVYWSNVVHKDTLSTISTKVHQCSRDEIIKALGSERDFRIEYEGAFLKLYKTVLTNYPDKYVEDYRKLLKNKDFDELEKIKNGKTYTVNTHNTEKTSANAMEECKKGIEWDEFTGEVKFNSKYKPSMEIVPLDEEHHAVSLNVAMGYALYNIIIDNISKQFETYGLPVDKKFIKKICINLFYNNTGISLDKLKMLEKYVSTE